MPPFVHRMPVRFADVDHAGIVYYPTFLHYFHVCFEEMWNARLGARAYARMLDEDRVGFPSVSCQCDFHAPLRFGDTAEIEMSIARFGTKSVTFRYRIYRAPDDDGGERVLAAEGRNVCAFVDLSRFRAIAAPEKVRDLLSDLVETGD